MVKLKIYFSFLLSILFGVQYPEFSINVNNNPYPADLFLHNTSPNQTQFMAIIDSNLELKWHIVSVSGKGWDFKVNHNDKLTYFRKPSNDFKLTNHLINSSESLNGFHF